MWIEKGWLVFSSEASERSLFYTPDGKNGAPAGFANYKGRVFGILTPLDSSFLCKIPEKHEVLVLEKDSVQSNSSIPLFAQVRWKAVENIQPGDYGVYPRRFYSSSSRFWQFFETLYSPEILLPRFLGYYCGGLRISPETKMAIFHFPRENAILAAHDIEKSLRSLRVKKVFSFSNHFSSGVSLQDRQFRKILMRLRSGEHTRIRALFFSKLSNDNEYAREFVRGFYWSQQPLHFIAPGVRLKPGYVLSPQVETESAVCAYALRQALLSLGIVAVIENDAGKKIVRVMPDSLSDFASIILSERNYNYSVDWKPDPPQPLPKGYKIFLDDFYVYAPVSRKSSEINSAYYPVPVDARGIVYHGFCIR